MNMLFRVLYARSKYFPIFAPIAILNVSIANLIFPDDRVRESIIMLKFWKESRRTEFHVNWYLLRVCELFFWGKCIQSSFLSFLWGLVNPKNNSVISSILTWRIFVLARLRCHPCILLPYLNIYNYINFLN